MYAAMEDLDAAMVDLDAAMVNMLVTMTNPVGMVDLTAFHCR